MNIKLDTAISHFIEDYYECKITNTPVYEVETIIDNMEVE